ncbi:MAG: glycosyltransferase 36 associated protein, partial [Gammaproteobacteria bacterium]|nr:glycosyltransferase 36 associated protein [Gammaproteobacteria bacterium]
IYGVSPRTGQAGWTWYTGSAAWLYRIVLEQVLGFQPRAGELQVRPCVPRSWPNFDIDYRVGESNYAISVVDPAEIAKSGARYEVDGKSVMAVRLLDDGEDHRVVVSPSESESA